MMIVHRYIVAGLFIVLFPATAAHAALSAQDAEISVSPVVRQYPVTALGSASAPELFTVTNHGAQNRTMGSITLEGLNAGEFAKGADLCSGQTLAAGTSCSVSVMFKPLTRGTKSAELRIPSDDPQTPLLCAFVTSQISASAEAQQRMPPVLVSNSIPELMQAGQTYELSWTLEGYHDAYTSYAVLFDCTGQSECGADYGEASKFAESAAMSAAEITQGGWTYRGEGTKYFRYVWNFSVPATREDGSAWAPGGTEVVVRFYCKSDIDAARQSGSVSLLIPGNQSAVYYDTSGRRIVKRIGP
jgi:hypothetical protein